MIGNFFITNSITIVCMVYIIFIMIIYFLKGRTSNLSSKVFVWLLFITILTMISFISWGTLASMESNLADLFGKIMSFMMTCWDFVLVFYMTIVFKNDDENSVNIKKRSKLGLIIFFLFLVINLICVILLNFNTTKLDNAGLYVMGGGLKFYVNVMGGISILYSIIVMIVYRKRLDTLTTVVGLFVTLIAVVSIITGVTGIMPLNDMCFLHSLVVMFLYLSLESQDRNLLIEFKKTTKNAEESNNIKKEFIIDMSRQLRTPMNAILGFSDSLLNTDNLTQEMLNSDSDYIDEASKKLYELINSILDMSRLESDKEIIENKNYCLDSVVYDISSNINSLVTSDNLIFTINADEVCPNELIGDEVKLAKILNIFLSNAFNCILSGEISLNISSNKIDSLNYEFLFKIDIHGYIKKDVNYDNLIKLNSSFDNNIDTYTLKVIIAKRLLDLIGGSIEVISNGENDIHYNIKLKQKLYGQNILGNIKDKIQNIHSLTYNVVDLSDKKILIIDEGKINSIILNRLLNQYKCLVDITTNPRDGINLVDKNNYDMLFISNEMDDMSGKQVVKKLESTGNRLPVLIGLVNLSSVVENDIYNDVLSCPIEFKKLNKIINKYFSKGE